jgi:hypothetical protein
LLIIPPAVIGDGFKDYQLKLAGYGIGEFRVLKWLNKMIRLDRATDPPVSQFPPIKVQEPFQIQHSPIIIENQPPFIPSPPNSLPEPNNIQTAQQITEAPQVATVNHPLPQSPNHDSSSKSSSADSTETPAEATPSVSSHSYKDYLYMKWFHGSPKATYFSENPVPDKLVSVIDSKTEQVSIPAAPVKIENDDSTGHHHLAAEDQHSGLSSFISDSILYRMFNKIKQMAVPKIQKEDIGPLKFYDEPPKPQSFPIPPKIVVFSQPYNPPLSGPNQTDSAQLLDTHLANNLSAPAYNDPANSKSPIQQEEPAQIAYEFDTPLSDQEKATTFNPPRLDYGLSGVAQETAIILPELAYDLPIPADNQPAEPASFSVPDINDSQQPQTTINAAERIYVPLQTAYSPNKRLTIDNSSEQLDEPDNSALLLAFKPQVPTYA